MGDTVVWINIEIFVFWFNVVVMLCIVMIEKYLTSMKTKLFRFRIQREAIDDELMKHYSFDTNKHDEKFKCGTKNWVNNCHIWVVHQDDVDIVENMKKEVLDRIEVAKKENKLDAEDKKSLTKYFD